MMNIAVRPFCTLAVGLLAGLSEAGCTSQLSAGDTTHSFTLFENMGYNSVQHVESCMDDNPSPAPSCM